ncbi:hypothetical protein [Flavobacterium sp. C4GT6]|uniref:hypothetical protein n=1 Tax=Flavobacterium sp. C4GT6 TaxID=3103818 RepID=UPI002ED6B732
MINKFFLLVVFLSFSCFSQEENEVLAISISNPEQLIVNVQDTLKYRIVSPKADNNQEVTTVKLVSDCLEQGIVVVEVHVDRSGKVIKAVPGVRGTTNNAACLLEMAKKAALETKFNGSNKAPEIQLGNISYDFRLTD